MRSQCQNKSLAAAWTVHSRCLSAPAVTSWKAVEQPCKLAWQLQNIGPQSCCRPAW